MAEPGVFSQIKITKVATTIKFIVDTGKEDDLVDNLSQTMVHDWKDEKLLGYCI